MQKKSNDEKVLLDFQHFKNFTPNFDDNILRSHNISVYYKILAGFAKTNKVLVEQATGTGKTFLMMKLLKDHLRNGGRALFVSPTLAIQNYFLSFCEKYLGYKKGRGSEINLIARQYAGLKNIANKNFDIIILDEVHRIGAKKWGESVKILLDTNKNAFVLGMTATLDRADKVDIRSFFNNNNPVSKLTLIDAIKRGILPAPDYTLSKINYNDDRDYIYKTLNELNKQFENAHGKERAILRTLIGELELACKYIDQNKSIPEILGQKLKTTGVENFKFIVFCPVGKDDSEDKRSQLKMEAIMAKARDWFDEFDSRKIYFYAVHSLYRAEKNKNAIEAFSSNQNKGIKLLFAVNMLNEGLHISDVDGIIMMRDTESKTIYLQQLGRALSVGHSQQPLIFDFVANINYVDVANIVNFFKEVNINNLDDSKLKFKLNVESLQVIRFIDRIKQKILAYNHRFDYNFDDYYRRIENYYIKFGNSSVPVSYKDEDGYPLGIKTAGIRTGNISLSDIERKKLSSLGFIWKVRGNLMQEYFAHLAEFLRSFGHTTVPYNYVCADGYPLGVKTTCIRSGTIKTTESDVLELNRMGFAWKVYKNLGDEFIEEFRRYIAEHKSKNVPTNYITPSGYKLGSRVRSLRSGRMKITDKQHKILDEMGFVWEVREHLIKEYIIQLRQYVNKFNTAVVPISYITAQGYPLGQKTKLIRNGGISTTLKEMEELNNLGFIWDLHKYNFDEFVSELRKYKHSFKNCRIKLKYITPNGYPLGRKVASIRRGDLKLSIKEQKILDSLGFVWSVKSKVE